MRFNKLKELLQKQQEEFKRLSTIIDRLSKQFEFEFPTDLPEDPDVYVYYDKSEEPRRPSQNDVECFYMAMYNLTLDQLVILKDALEAKEQYIYCQIITQRILDMKAAEIIRSKLNDFLT